MAISINWGTKVVTIPQNYMTDLGGDVWELDTDQLRLDLKDLEDSEAGIAKLDTHSRNAPVTIGGTTYAQTLEIINGYTITFENGAYAVSLTGSNNNISEVTNVNNVSLRSNNSAGLIVSSGSGTTAAEIWEYPISGKEAQARLKDAEDNAETSIFT